jgi:hypothetical protein
LIWAPNVVEHKEGDIASVIRAKIKAGVLPAGRALKVWIGPANGRTPCDGCEQTIVVGGLEYEIDTSDRRTVRFHRECFNLWRQERVRARAEPA